MPSRPALRLAVTFAALCAAPASATAGTAAVQQVVTGTVAPVIGAQVDVSGRVLQRSGTLRMRVTREQTRASVIVTVWPDS
jgi:hypothetical protein